MAGQRVDLRKASDQALLSAALHRDAAAWRELMRRFRPLIFRCILRVCKRYGHSVSGEDINEIFGDVCVNLLRDDMHKLRAYDPNRGARLSSWLGLLSINAAYDFLRQSIRRPVLIHLQPIDGQKRDPLYDLCAEDEKSALDELLEREKWNKIDGLLQDFSRRDRDFVELYFRAGLSPEQVAETMGISVKTVYSKKNKVCARLLQKAHTNHLASAA